MINSYLESNEKKKAAKATKLNSEDREKLQKYLEDYKKFKDLSECEYWKDCVSFIKDEIYKGLSLAPGDGGDWWLKYCWGLKTFIERVESHAKKYDEAYKELSK